MLATAGLGRGKESLLRLRRHTTTGFPSIFLYVTRVGCPALMLCPPRLKSIASTEDLDDPKVGSPSALVRQVLSEPPDSEQDSVDESLRPGRTSRNVNVHGQDLVNASKRRVVLAEDTAADAACANRDDYLRLWHRSIRLQQRQLHVPGDRTGDQEHVGVTRRCHKLNSEAFDVMDRIVEGDNLHFASVA